MSTKRIVLWLIATVGSLCLPTDVHGVANQSLYLRLEALGKKALDLEYLYRVREDDTRIIRYRLFLPNPIDRSNKYPLVVWLHGAGDYGNDNLSQLVHMDTTIYPGGQVQDCPFFLCAIQCSNGNWLTDLDEHSNDSNPLVGHADMLDVTLKVVDQLQREYSIDEKRILILGISAGGTACWDLLSRQPHRFAAIVPFGASNASVESMKSIDSMIDTPVWAFHAEHDPGTPVDGVAGTVKSLQAAGGKAWLTMTDDNRHNCWMKAFADHDLLHWLLAQRRGDINAPLPGHYRPHIKLTFWWKEHWPRVILLVVFVGLVWACYRHLQTLSRSGTLLHDDQSDNDPFGNRFECAPDPHVSTWPVPLDNGFKVPDFSMQIGDDQ